MTPWGACPEEVFTSDWALEYGMQSVLCKSNHCSVLCECNRLWLHQNWLIFLFIIAPVSPIFAATNLSRPSEQDPQLFCRNAVTL